MARKPETWSELANVGITILGGSEVQFATITETVDIDLGDKDFDAIATLGGGRLVKFNPQDVTTITLEAYPLEAGTANVTMESTDGTTDMAAVGSYS